MKNKIVYSKYVIAVTAIAYGIFFIGCILTLHDKPLFYTFLAAFLIAIITGLMFGPWYIRADKDYVIARSILKSKKIPVRDIESIELFQPTMGAVRILGSGGFMGYWGMFKEGDIGRYRAFYGKASDCFLIRMKNGEKYVPGCETPNKMVEHIKSLLAALKSEN